MERERAGRGRFRSNCGGLYELDPLVGVACVDMESVCWRTGERARHELRPRRDGTKQGASEARQAVEEDIGRIDGSFYAKKMGRQRSADGKCDHAGNFIFSN